VGLVGVTPLILVTHPSLPVRNMKDLLALAKAQPGQIIYASSGPGSPTHMAMELLRFLGERQCSAGILLLSNSDRRLLSVAEQMALAMGLRVIGVMCKPFVRSALEAVLRHELGVKTLDRAHKPALPLITQAALWQAITEKQFALQYEV
jgi:hypothetical protein